MSLLVARKAFRDALAPLAVPVRFQGEAQPAGAATYVVVTVVTDTDLETLDALAPASNLRLQLDVWSTADGATAQGKADEAKALLAPLGWHRLGPGRLGKEGDWHRASADYESLI